MFKIKDKKKNVYFFFLEFKLGTKEGTVNEKSYLHIFIKFIKKIKKSEIVGDKKMSEGIEENK